MSTVIQFPKDRIVRPVRCVSMVEEAAAHLAEERLQETQRQAYISRLVEILERKASDPNDPFAKRLKYLRDRAAAREAAGRNHS